MIRTARGQSERGGSAFRLDRSLETPSNQLVQSSRSNICDLPCLGFSSGLRAKSAGASASGPEGQGTSPAVRLRAGGGHSGNFGPQRVRARVSFACVVAKWRSGSGPTRKKPKAGGSLRIKPDRANLGGVA